VCAVAPDQVFRTHGLLAVCAREDSPNFVGVLFETGELRATFDRDAQRRKLFGEDPLRLVLGYADEFERHVRGQPQFDAPDLGTVDVHDLSAHVNASVENLPQYTHAFEYF
jgi:hypothetical protein